MKEFVINLIYPRRCPICDQVIGPAHMKICKDCIKKVPYIQEPSCKRCGKKLSNPDEEYCYDCARRKHYYNEGVAVFRHDKKIKNSIYKFKYNNKREYADFYIEELINHHKRKILSWEAQAIVPVPLYRAKKIQRGYNQSEVLAKKLKEKINIPLDTGLLTRTKPTEAQKELNRAQREKNVENAFKIGREIVQYKKIILIDDIYTTGATVDSCAKTLKKNGIEDVYFISISIGDGY